MWDLLYWLFSYIVKYIWLVKRDEMNNILKLFLVMIFKKTDVIKQAS